jgi:tRNA pseudouridine38-40 synthase
MPNIKGVVEYDGTNYSGWQRQINSNSIQQTLEEALSTVLREKISIVGSGRTDAGVHALNQVFNFRSNSKIDLPSVRKALNSILPNDISIKYLETADEDFHSRFSAISREYLYIISLRKNVFCDRFCWTIFGKLDLETLKNSQEIFIGKKNFAAFCKNSDELENVICTVDYSRWLIRKEILFYFIRADRFIHGMVRGIVGCMIEIARGRLDTNDVRLLFSSDGKAKGSYWAPASGLVLYKVNY